MIEIGAKGIHSNGPGNQGPVDARDPLAILGHMGDEVTLSPGTTAAALMRALMPWSDVLSRMGDIDMVAWDRALSRGHLRDAGAPAPRGAELCSLVIRPEVRVTVGGIELQVAWTTSARDAADPAVAYAVPGNASAWCRLPVTLDHQALVHSGLPGGLKVTPTLYDSIVLGFLADISFEGSPEQAALNEDTFVAMASELT